MIRPIPFLASPVMLAPIAGPGTPELTAAATRAGAFSFLASAYSDADRLRHEIARVRSLTDKPFGINIFADTEPAPIERELLAAANARLDVYRDELGIARTAKTPLPSSLYREQLAVVLAERPRAFSFTFGIPSRDELGALREAGIYTIGTATSVEEALALEAAGVDAVCAQGAEAGGHRGSFLAPADPPLIGTMALVPQVVDAVALPVIAAGGIIDGRGVAAALALGATAAQLGTAFLRASEAQTVQAYREALAHSSSADTVLTQAFSGRYARGIENRLTSELADPASRAPYPYQNALTRDIRNAAAKEGRPEFLSLWAGQAFPLARSESAETIVRETIEETLHALDEARARFDRAKNG